MRALPPGSTDAAETPVNAMRRCKDSEKQNWHRAVAAALPGALWTARGFKPCYLWDVSEATERGVAHCLRACGSTPGSGDVRAFRLGRCDVLLCNVPETLRKLADAHLAFKFVDVSSGLLCPTVPASPPAAVLAMLASLTRTLAEVDASPPRSEGIINLEPAHGSEWNLCTAFGVLLGYPVVYWFKGGVDAGNCLAMEELNVVRVRSSGCPEERTVRRTTAHDDVYSFSFPAILDGDLRPHVDAWWRRLRAKAEASDVKLTRVDEVRSYPIVAL
ncbi:hypothetical protein HPB50_025616 [Hyalomma asiaticum]|uniref:Uncharacterized protein n=1 Tax=Hyalomma asiaticum TaxID=266040 RepID=A0ACB7TC17_HYAAI|nr:hypothetical protein HPB50_025616 [Hyalomma asiaticum]